MVGEIQKVNVYIINCFDTYEHRVDLLKRSFDEKGHSVTVLTSDFKHIDKVIVKEHKKGFIYFHAKPYTKNLSVTRMKSHIDVSSKIFEYVIDNIGEIDVLWVLVPPNTFVRDAAKVKERFPRIKLIFDFIDLWPETMPLKGLKDIWPCTEWRNRRGKYVSCADYVVTECELFRRKLRNEIKATKSDVLYLARDIEFISSNPNLPSDKIALCYLGSINNIIDIECIAEIIRQLNTKHRVELNIIGDGEKREELIAYSQNAGAEVTYHGKIYDAIEKQKIFDKCHFGLNIMKQTVCVGLTMKSMDYFEAGLPIINNIHGDTWSFVEKLGIGVNYDVILDVREALSNNLKIRKKIRDFYKCTFDSKFFSQKANRILEVIHE